MYGLLPPLAPHVVAYRIGGTIEADTIEDVFAAIDDALERNPTVHLYAEIESLGGMTLDALVRETASGLRLLPRLRRFGRYAVVTDTAWIQTAVRLEDWLFPGLALRAFGFEEAEEARAWVLETPA